MYYFVELRVDTWVVQYFKAKFTGATSLEVFERNKNNMVIEFPRYHVVQLNGKYIPGGTARYGTIR